jgi:hypothetical protein
MATALKGDFSRHLRNIAECRLRVASGNMVEIVVSEFNARRLPQLKQEYEILLSQLVRQQIPAVFSKFSPSVSNGARMVLHSQRWGGNV